MTHSLRELGRYSEPALFILVSLAAGPRHGYAIKTDVETFSGTTLGPGTLYGAIARLEARGFIEALESDDRRRPYRLTEAGRSALEAETRQLRTITTLATERLGAS